jgi:hypothetical protein
VSTELINDISRLEVKFALKPVTYALRKEKIDAAIKEIEI